MQLNPSKQFKRVLLFTALTAASGLLLISGTSHAQENAAKLVKLHDNLARDLLELKQNPTVPVLVAKADKQVYAFLFASNSSEVDNRFNELFTSGDIPGCSHGGPVECCKADGKMVLSVVVESGSGADPEPGWLETGEICQGSRGDAEFIAVPAVISGLLNSQYGIDHCTMNMSDGIGQTTVLVNVENQDSIEWRYCLGGLNFEKKVDTLFRPILCRFSQPYACSVTPDLQHRCDMTIKVWYKSFYDVAWCTKHTKCNC